MLLVISMVKKLLEHYIKKKVETSQTKFRVEKLIKRKGYRLHVKWKGYDDSFNSWINMKYIV